MPQWTSDIFIFSRRACQQFFQVFVAPVLFAIMGPALAKPAGPTYPIELAPGASREGKVCVRLFGVSESEIWVTRVVPNII